MVPDNNDDEDKNEVELGVPRWENGWGPIDGSTDDSTTDTTGSTTDGSTTDDSTSDSGGTTYTEPPDESTAYIENFNVNSSSPEEIEVTFSVQNEVFSGSGEYLSGSVDVSIDGNVVETFNYGVGAYSQQSFTVTASNVSSGTRNVCANIN